MLPSTPRLSALCCLIAAFLLVGCATDRSAITQYGTMREALREGRSEPRIGVARVAADHHAVAVGALAGLAGEITIFDGQTWVTRKAAGGVESSGPAADASDQATLLTVASVESWITIDLPGAVPPDRLEGVVESCARERGLDTSKPFPFVVEGTLTGLDAHVIAGYCPESNPPPDRQPWRPALPAPPAPTRATLVGFFAPNQEGVMTHHGTSLHMHAVFSLDGVTVTAHADSAALAPGARLRLPGAPTKAGEQR
jgi:acetolactate decarboxylase